MLVPRFRPPFAMAVCRLDVTGGRRGSEARGQEQISGPKNNDRLMATTQANDAASERSGYSALFPRCASGRAVSDAISIPATVAALQQSNTGTLESGRSAGRIEKLCTDRTVSPPGSAVYAIARPISRHFDAFNDSFLPLRAISGRMTKKKL